MVCSILSHTLYIRIVPGKMPTILSFDIGTRHLAYCSLQYTSPTQPPPTQPPPTITHWKVVDLLAVPGTPYDESCTYVLAKSWKCDALRAYLDGQRLSSVGTRSTLVDRIHADLKARNVPKVAGTNLNVLATKMYAYLDSQPWMTECHTVVLENQPCLTNPIMKSVQMILYGYFMYKGVWCTFRDQHQHQNQNQETDCTASLPRVMLTSATNKLKVCGGGLRDADAHGEESSETKGGGPAPTGKLAYKHRKQAAIALTDALLTQWHTDAPPQSDARQQWATWRTLLEDSCMKEKDDLSDSFLQGLFVIRKGEEEQRKAADKRAKQLAKAAKKTATKAVTAKKAATTKAAQPPHHPNT